MSKFKVTGLSNIVCCGCGGITNVAPKRVYNTDDLTCNCEDKEELMKFTVTHISDIVRIDNNHSVRVLPDSVYMFDDEDNIEEINNANMDMFEEPYHHFTKTACIEVIGQDGEGNVLVQNIGDSSDRWVIPSETFLETYEAVETPPAADVSRPPADDDIDDTDEAGDGDIKESEILKSLNRLNQFRQRCLLNLLRMLLILLKQG